MPPQRPTDDPPTEGWATLTEAVKILGVSAWTVRQLADAGKLPCWRPTPTSYRRFDRAVLREYRDRAARAQAEAAAS